MRELLQKTFENAFNETHYKELIRNLFNRFDFSKEHTLRHQFNEAEKQALNDFIYLGTFEDSQNKSLDVLITALKGGSKVERARSLQRNLIGKYLKNNLKDSALVAFYSKDNLDWRLSFVKVDYRLDDKGAKVEIGTPPKRYSFLVGKTEPSHTAQKQLLSLLDDKKVPLVDELEKSFSIEKVTKEFYTEIAKKFTELVGGERKIGSKKIIEAGFLKYPKPSDILRKEFAVRLIGRLLFCWFLKKKKSDAGVSLIPNVILSSDAIRQYPDYYHSLLEPLFFQVLNTPIEKRNKNVRHNFWNSIPFLNGGLFEPHLHDYHEIYYESGISKYINTLKIPDEWFLDLFKIFEIYNFTIDESTTIDVDISVDPEMLGRIFENLLAEINPETGETARKSTGSYYTPRPIVEYMVDESLKQYLKTQTGIDEVKLANLLSYAENAEEVTESEKDLIIDALDRVKIIDPACGSGAFPMGILHKMLLILQKIDPESKKWLTRKLARIDNKLLRKELESKLKTENWDYVHKLGIIQNSIYGVDIQPIAVEISKLRFFLSLIVDEKIDDKKLNRGIVPLPNLEFKFVAANSLIGLPQYEKETTIDFSEADHKIEELKKLREDYFTSIGEEKHKIEEEFLEKQKEMLEQVINWQKKHKKSKDSQALKLSEWNPFADEAVSWFDPEWMFGVKDGFDVVLANPPYHQLSKDPLAKKDYKDYLKARFRTSGGRLNTFIFFLHEGIELLLNEGNLVYIIPNTFLTQEYYKETRKLLLDTTNISQIVHYPTMQFENAIVENITIQLIEDGPSKKTSFLIQNTDKISSRTEYNLRLKSIPPNYSFNITENSILEKIEKTKYVALNELCEINQAIALKGDKNLSLGDNNLKGKFFKLLDGRNINRYSIKWGGVYLDYNLDRIHSCKRRDIFETDEKLLFRRVSSSLIFAYDTEKYYALNTIVVVNKKHNSTNLKFLLGLLNSKLINYYYIEKYKSTKKVFSEIQARSIGNLPIINIDLLQKPLITLVDQILAVKQKDPNADTSALEWEIDQMVYKFYDLTPEEIAIVEG